MTDQNASSEEREDTIEIAIKVFGGLRTQFPASYHRFRVPAHSRIDDLLSCLREHLPEFVRRIEDGIAAGYLNALLNGRNIRFLEGRESLLADGDTVAFLPPVGGG